MAIHKLLPLSALIVLTACSGNSEPTNNKNNTAYIHEIISPTGDVLGSVSLKDLGMGGTSVMISVSGISEGQHAMHFHEVGKCEGPDFKSSGGHYNPDGRAHGKKVADGPHVGDMMNINVGADQKGEFMIVNERVSIHGDHDLPALFDADGTALILHEKADDYESQPSGAAGARIGCALIKP
ncbi:Cu-Zn family superoxide dismutase [Litorimonas taeanensis]|uniref:Cu-Zn family superoxide dismutase n=1 Tax=Litorimonas taeanensis TaxID=568099 RepID=A0A420WKH8_9PROT|nr:superoxide dismutase family protein [Litorimonas taeanensis]RKQ71517.1 Cu-Zn family superoxide dismutase [Litorimonas taeanensis]